MKKAQRSIVSVALVTALVMVLSSGGWAQERKVSNDEMNLLDLLVARPLGIIAAAGGTCVFVVSLPFTLATKSTNEALNLFVMEPLRFSLVREFPDETTH